MHKALSALCAGAALWLCVWIASASGAPRFELVSYAERGGALHAETLDTGLSARDCAFALGAASRPAAVAEVLLTCEHE